MIEIKQDVCFKMYNNNSNINFSVHNFTINEHSIINIFIKNRIEFEQQKDIQIEFPAVNIK